MRAYPLDGFSMTVTRESIKLTPPKVHDRYIRGSDISRPVRTFELHPTEPGDDCERWAQVLSTALRAYQQHPN